MAYLCGRHSGKDYNQDIGDESMSQKKVDEYKKYKANRKQILAREKKMRKVKKVLGMIAAVLVIGGFGYWGYYTYQVETAPQVTFANLIGQDQYGIIQPIISEN